MEEVHCLRTAKERHRQKDGQTDRPSDWQTDGKAISAAERLLRNPH